MAVADLTESYRQAQEGQRIALLQQLALLWPALSYAALDATFPTWAAAVAALVDAERQQAAQLATAYVHGVRAYEGVRGAAPTVPAAPVDRKQLVTSLLVTGVLSVKKATGRGVPQQSAMRTAFAYSAGAAFRHVANAGRDTVVETVRADPHARGWRRITSGHACPFCQLLAGRGSVYKHDTVGFQAHDHCSCTAQPEYAR